MKKRATINDIAAAAGVSKATVSNVMNKKYDKVNDETYEKIVKIMKEMDYEPNFTAKSLSTGKSKLISVIIPVGSDYINVKENSFYFEFFLGVESIAAKKGYDIILSGMLKENGYRELIKKEGNYNLTKSQLSTYLENPYLNTKKYYDMDFPNIRYIKPSSANDRKVSGVKIR